MQRDRIATTIKLSLVAAGLWGGYLGYTYPAASHTADKGWKYPLECCHDRDCAEIPASAVRATAGGYHVTLSKGQHPMLKEYGYNGVIRYDATRASPDGAYHICLSPSIENHHYCFFAPPPGA